MNEIPDELKDFYDSIENLNSLSIWNIHRELKVTAKIKGDWEKKIIVERKSLNYNLNKGELVTNVQVTDSQGQITPPGSPNGLIVKQMPDGSNISFRNFAGPNSPNTNATIQFTGGNYGPNTISKLKFDN